MTRPQPSLGPWQTATYASGNLGKNLFWSTLDITLLFVMTELMGLSPAAAGGIVLASLVFDAVLGPLVGAFADRLRTPIGRFGPLILVGAPLSGLTFVLLFALPVLGIRDAYAVAFVLMTFRFSYSLLDVPHNALITLASTDSHVRSRIAGYRFFFSSLASLVLALSLAPTLGRGLSAEGVSAPTVAPDKLLVFASCIALAAVVVLVMAWLAMRHHDRRVASLPASPRADLGRRLGALVGSGPYVVALLSGTLATLFLPLFNKSLLYLGQHVLDDVGMVPRVLTGLVMGQFVGLPLWIWLSLRWEKARCMQVAHGVCVAGFASILFTLEHAPATLIVCAAVIGVGLSGVYSIIWSMIADCVEAIHVLKGVRADGLVFAFAIFLQKTAIGLGAAVFGLALDASGYEQMGIATTAVKTTVILFNLGLPLAGSVLCIILLAFYDLTHARHAVLSGCCVSRCMQTGTR